MNTDKITALEAEKKALSEHIHLLDTEIEQLKQESEKPKTVWDLEHGDRYYILDAGGAREWDWEGHTYDLKIRNLGNAFLTKEEAENELRRRNLITKAKKSQGGFKPDFGDDTKKWYIQAYQRYRSELQVDWQMYVNVFPALGWWPTDKSAWEFIDENRAELEWYFGLEGAE